MTSIVFFFQIKIKILFTLFICTFNFFNLLPDRLYAKKIIRAQYQIVRSFKIPKLIIILPFCDGIALSDS